MQHTTACVQNITLNELLKCENYNFGAVVGFRKHQIHDLNIT